MEKGKLIVCVGLPASGKSTYAKKYRDEHIDNCIIVSSDELRKELFGSRTNQEHNSEVFEEMFKITREGLKQGYTVIYDATNINRRRRMGLLNQLNKYCSEKICLFTYRNLNQIEFWNSIREYSVPCEVIKGMYKNFHIPYYTEGFDKIEIIHDFQTNIYYKNEFLDKIRKLSLSDYQMLLDYTGCRDCIGYAQNSVYHSLTVDKHMYKSYLLGLGREDINELELLARLFHDCKKPKTTIVDKDCLHYHFHFHDNVSAYESLQIMLELGLNEQDALYVANLINRHMMFKGNWKTNDEDINDKLMRLHEDDMKAK